MKITVADVIVRIDRALYSDDPPSYHREFTAESYPALRYSMIPLACTLFGAFLILMPLIIIPAVFADLQGLKTWRNLLGLSVFYAAVALLHSQLLKLRIPATTRHVTQAYYRIIHRRLAYAYVATAFAVVIILLVVFKRDAPSGFFTVIGSLFSLTAILEFLGSDREKYYDAITFSRMERLRARQPLRVRLFFLLIVIELAVACGLLVLTSGSSATKVREVTATATAIARATPGPKLQVQTVTATATAIATAPALPGGAKAAVSAPEDDSVEPWVSTIVVSGMLIGWMAWVNPQVFHLRKKRRRWEIPENPRIADGGYWSWLTPAIPVYYVDKYPGTSWSQYHRLCDAYVAAVHTDHRHFQLFNYSLFAWLWRRMMISTHDQDLGSMGVSWAWNGMRGEGDREYLLIWT